MRWWTKQAGVCNAGKQMRSNREHQSNEGAGAQTKSVGQPKKQSADKWLTAALGAGLGGFNRNVLVNES
jgi:hypothetical protein